MSEGHALTASIGALRARAVIAWWLAPPAVGAGTLALGVVSLGDAPLSTEEAVAVTHARQPVGSLLHTVVHDDPAQAGFLLVLKAAALVGTDERTMRIASLVALSLAAALTVLLGTLLAGRVAGLVGGLALGAHAGTLDAAREVAPYALGILGVVAATLALALAVERGGTWRWGLYAVACATLPLTHPLAASALLAHGAALAVIGERARRGLLVVTPGAILAAAAIGWMAVDRHAAPDGTQGLHLPELGRGVLAAFGSSPVLAVAAAAGLAGLWAGRIPGGSAWKAALISGLVAAPVAVAVVTAAALPVYADRALVLCAPGLALAAGSATRLLPNRKALGAGVAALLGASAALIGSALSMEPKEDWRAVAAAVRNVRKPRETVVVLPERSRGAFAYYAPNVRTQLRARGDGAWVVVAADERIAATVAAREAVPTPTYALLRQSRYGDGLRLQHWVRP